MRRFDSDPRLHQNQLLDVFMTVKLDLPIEIEQAYRAEAQARGLSFDEIVREVLIAGRPKTVFEQGLGLFGNQEDAALLDEVVSIAYEERRRPARSPF
jgi:hypothetical protein